MLAIGETLPELLFLDADEREIAISGRPIARELPPLAHA